MKITKQIYKILSVIISCLLVVFALLLVGVRLFGFTPYTILSASMEPKYPVGSLIYIRPIEKEDIVVTDDITYVFDEQLNVVTHQVIEISDDGEYFFTQGLANQSPDTNPVYYENILGKVYFCIPLLGYVASFLSSPLGLIISILLILIWCVLIYMVELYRKNKN